MPVWEARAAVCLKLGIVDDEFDSSDYRHDCRPPWPKPAMASPPRQVSVGSAPSSASPFTLTTATAGTRAFNVITVASKPTK